MFLSPAWVEHDKGLETEEEEIRDFVSAAPEYEKEIRQVYENLGECVWKLSYAVPWVQELKNQGIRVFALSNWPKHIYCLLYTSMDALYIADGHHRAASAVRVGVKRREEHPGYTGEEEFNYFLSVIFPDDELMIMDYNRVVKDLNGLTPEQFLDRVREVFEVRKLEKAAHPEKKGEVTLFLEDQWYLLTLKPAYENTDPVEGLDVSVLQKQILAPVLGIQDPKTDKRIDFVGGIRGLSELERRVHTDMKAAFAMYPLSLIHISFAESG